MPYTRNTSGTTSDGMLDALTDLAGAEVHTGYTDVSVASLSASQVATSNQTAAVPANANRKALILSNPGLTDGAIAITPNLANAQAAGCIPLYAGGTYVFDDPVPTNAIYAVGFTAGAKLTAWEA